MAGSILDQVLSSKKLSAISSFDPNAIGSRLFGVLSDRERDILTKRYGLEGSDRVTLEEIGKRYAVTRERVRQVENASIKKIRSSFADSIIKDVESIIRSILEDHGYIMSESRIVEYLLGNSSSDASSAFVRFILNQILDEQLELTRESNDSYKSWSIANHSWDSFRSVIDMLISIVESHGEPILLEELVRRSKESVQLPEDLKVHHDSVIMNYLDITKKIEENKFNEWGLSSWSSIRPRRMNDKILLVMKRFGKPLHFTEIAKKINEVGFDSRVAYPATIHNELILDENYVLVGRGIYALREWGYKPGVVLDVIRDVLGSGKRPMTRDEIITEVLKNRMVKRSTVILALMNRKLFKKDTDGNYILI